ncbi:hypothetical protein AN639_12730 [Candidatus Epulonipiscium fishelsonii]|uniref:Uncharacterized protein n=1 Tax=Candidatus Epulonipiscium fishelsonii TaxID=77094 RepID=A0ACC8XGU3_9FIRM|nr:hypothetical protein AN639_12730 [Epulopiscium sp. SCG-B05WGA-EpuloA1]ONI42709.1 hypothetical protein AN396_13550 [Epulopiscium sp. SCG-B11WGA-EpuloA1]ONI47033.1 hypothetical protein AN644_01910 [Epulopiscium sp. SCG-C06WGA-EpuloA1]
MILFKSNERLDDIQCNGYHLIQNPNVFCFGIDAVLLAHYAKVIKPNQKILDIGTGTGIIPILMHGINKRGKYTAVEVQESMAEMANRSVILNNLQNDIQVKCMNIMDYRQHFIQEQFDTITCNPPYMKNNNGLQNINHSKTIARHEIACTLEDIIDASSHLLKERGKLVMIHRTHRLVDLLELMRKHRIEPKRMRLVYPKISKPPTMVLIEGTKYGNPELKVDAPLIE